MSFLRSLQALLCTMIPMLIQTLSAAAVPALQPSQSELALVTSLASMASYDGEWNLLTRDRLRAAGWTIETYEHRVGSSQGRFHLLTRPDAAILAFPGNVITYGAPAVGNEAFAKTYEPNMQLTRYTIDYDPVHTVLQSMYRGFAQFGTRVEWKKDRKVDMFPHNMTVYLDKVLRSYYDDPNRTKTLLYGTPMQTAGVLMAPIAFKMEDYLKEDQTYMDKALTDNIGSEYTDVRIAKHADMPNLTQEAKAQNCVYILRQRYTSERMRKSKDLMYHISLEEELCDRDGNVLTVQNLSTNTKNLTPLESVIYLQEQAKEQRSVFLSAPKFK